MHRQERQLLLKIVFPLANSKPQKPNFRWHGSFGSPLGWSSSGGKLDQEGRVWAHWSARRAKPTVLSCTVLSAWCYCADQKWGFFFSATGRVWCSDIICEPLCVRLAAESAGSAASGELDRSKADLTVSQNWWLTSNGKTDVSSRCCPQISHRNAHLMHNRARL